MKYQPINFNLNEKQIKKIQNAKAKNLSVTITINKKQFNTGKHTLYLTSSQHKKLSTIKTNKIRLTISKSQMKHQTGGWLGALLPIVQSILPTVGKVLGSLGLAGATGAISGLAEKLTKGGCVKPKKKIRGGLIFNCSNCHENLANQEISLVKKNKKTYVMSTICNACRKNNSRKLTGFEIGTIPITVRNKMIIGQKYTNSIGDFEFCYIGIGAHGSMGRGVKKARVPEINKLLADKLHQPFAKTIIKVISDCERKKKFPLGSTKIVKSELKQQNGGFIGPLLMGLASVAAPLITKIFSGNGIYRAGSQNAKGLYRAKGLFKKRKF